MSELTFGMRLTYDGKSAGAGLDETKAKLDGLSNSSGKLAAQNRMLGQTYKEHGSEVKNTSANVNKLLDRYDPLGAKLRQLQNDFKQLNAAAAGGKIGARDDARVDMVYANLQKQMTAASSAANGFAASSKNAALSTGQLRMATQQLPMQFTDIWVSLAAGQNPMMVMIQQGTQIKDSFGGVGASAKAMGSYIMGLINPITLAAAAAAAAGAAWYAWGRDAETAADKAVAASEKIIAGMRATDSVYVLQRERDKVGKQIPVQWLTYDEKALARLDGDSQKLIKEYKKLDKLLKGEVARSSREWDGLYATDAERKSAALKGEKQLYDEQVALAKGNSDKLIVLQQQHQQKVAAINKSFENKPKSSTKDDRTESEKAFADAWVETQRVLQNTDPQAKANAEWAKMLYLQSTLGEQFPLTAEQMGQAYAKAMGDMEKKTKQSADGMSEVWKTYRDSTQRVLGDQMFDAMMGKFSSLEDAFKQMIFRIAANAAAANLTEKLFGTNGMGGSASDGILGGIMSAFGFGAAAAPASFPTSSPSLGYNPSILDGIITGSKASGGPVAANKLYRVNEVGPELLNQDGKDYLMMGGRGGFVKPLGQYSAQIAAPAGGSQIVIHDHTTIHIDSRSDRAQVLDDVSRVTDAKLARWEDKLRRQGAIA